MGPNFNLSLLPKSPKAPSTFRTAIGRDPNKPKQPLQKIPAVRAGDHRAFAATTGNDSHWSIFLFAEFFSKAPCLPHFKVPKKFLAPRDEIHDRAHSDLSKRSSGLLSVQHADFKSYHRFCDDRRCNIFALVCRSMGRP